MPSERSEALAKVGIVYAERASSVPHAVVWTATPARYEPHRVLPDGGMDLIWYGHDLVVAGPDTVAQIADWSPARRFVGLRLTAGVGPRVLGVPAHVIRDQRLSLDDVWAPVLVEKLREQLLTATHPAAVLEAAARQALRRGAPPDPLGPYLMRRVADGDGVGHIADAAGLSPRQLQRRSLDAFGYGPKTLARIVRMNQALSLARAGTALADVAAETGYADQAHLSRDVKSLAGVSLSDILAGR